MNIQGLVKRFNDLPLKDKKLLINRDGELLTLSKLAENYDNSIVGVTGERGSGKTTVLNLFTTQSYSNIKLIVRIEEKDTKLDIIASLLRGICQNIQKVLKLKKFKSKSQETLDFLNYQEEKIHLMSVGISHIAKIEKEKGKSITIRYISSTIKEKLNEILEEMVKTFKITLCIDEIDKETSRDLVMILDSLKGILRKDNLIVFVSLPPQIYQNFLKDELLLREDYNLDDILKKIVALPQLSNEDILEIINSRLGAEFHSSISSEAKKVLIEYARGNPRRAILPIYQALGTKTTDELPITENDILTEIIPPLKQYIDTLRLTNTQMDILKILASRVPNTANKSELSDILIQENIKKSTVYDNIKKLTTKGILLEIDKNVYKLHPWVKIYFSTPKI